ncbi:MAG: TonB-dependent receptor, partial [Eudoraea sp.]
NIYYMRYKDQLVLTGELNDVGAPLRANVGDSYRLGLEVDASISIGKRFKLQPNIALSTNKNIDFLFERDGELENLGNTNIAFSPDIVVGNILSYLPNEKFQLSLLTKFVGKQFMGNIDAESSVLEDYSQTDFNIQYTFNTNTFIKSIVLSGLINNIFDSKFVSNGYFFTYDDDFSNPGTITTIEGAGYYPQAGINFLLGATFNF